MPPKRSGASAAGGRKKAGAGAMFEMAEAFSSGTILTDLCHKTWTMGTPIGQGGFGCLYECRSTSAKTPVYVVKVEPDSNGPLFCEMHFYLQLGKKTLQETFAKANRLDHLGVPQLMAHGMHVSTSSKRRYRFLIIPRYKQTLAVELQSAGARLDEKRVQSLGKQILDVFEYIHSHGYIHADIKAENIMMNDAVQIFLLDFGLSRKVSLQYEEKPQRRHEGTLEFTSLDVHRGAAPSFRGDLEILFYNMLHWLGARLPWLTITDGARVQQAKMTARSDPSGFVRNLFPSSSKVSTKMLDGLIQYFREIILMNYTDKGDYRRLRETITGHTRQRRSSIGAVASRKAVVELENDDDDDDEDEEMPEEPKKRASPRRSANVSTTTRARSASRDRGRHDTRRSRSPSPPIQMLSARTPTLTMLSNLPNQSRSKPHHRDMEEDENDIDMSALLHPKLSSTRIELPRRAPARAMNRPADVAPLAPTNNTSKTERPHSDIIEKVLAGIPLTPNEIRKVIHRKK